MDGKCEYRDEVTVFMTERIILCTSIAASRSRSLDNVIVNINVGCTIRLLRVFTDSLRFLFFQEAFASDTPLALYRFVPCCGALLFPILLLLILLLIITIQWLVLYFLVVLFCFYLFSFACPSNINVSRRSIHLTVLLTAEENTGTTLYNLHRNHDSTQETNHDQDEGMTTIGGVASRGGACYLRRRCMRFRVICW